MNAGVIVKAKIKGYKIILRNIDYSYNEKLKLPYPLIFCRFVRCLLHPLFLVGVVCVPFLRKRRNFEAKNRDDPYAVFHKDERVSLCFHVASEGEFEYIIPLAEKSLENHENKAIEILYTSPSVETAMRSFCEKYKKRVFSLRLPLLSVSGDLEKWVRGKTLIMVRYDFYPELLSLAVKMHSLLIHATLKNKTTGSFRKMVFNCFNGIIPSTEKDQERFETWGLNATIFPWFDFRVLRIENRLKNISEKLQQSFKTILVQKILQEYSFERSIIFGSFQEGEWAAFEDTSLKNDISLKKVFVLIVPHHTEKDIVDRVIFHLSKHIPVYKINEKTLNEYAKRPGVLVFDQRGFLLELYTLFRWAYVGGGHGKGIHSLLEPFMAGLQVFCGPKVSRSTEYDLICSLNKKKIHIVEQLHTFYALGKDQTNELPSAPKINVRKRYEKILEKMQL